MKKQFLYPLAVAIALLPLVYLALTWHKVPQTVPLHYGIDLKPDRFGDKAALWLPVSILAIVSLLTFFLLNNVHRLDPKRKAAGASAGLYQLALGLVVFVAALNGLLVSMAKGNTGLGNLLLPLVGGLFAFMGNYMVNIKPNYFAGFRLPWTLSSDDNWRRTHALSGRLWFGGGLLIVVGCLLLPPTTGFAFFLVVTLLLVIIPIVYSFRLFKRSC